MLSFVSPWLFGVAVAASLVVAGLHLLSVRTPPPMMLPTARFVPDGEARAVARRPRLNDVLLLLLRVCALLAAGAALAGVRWQRTTASELRLVIADEALRADTVWRDSVTRALTAPDVLVDVRFAAGVSREAGAALVAALQHAGALTEQYRSLSRVALTVVVPPRTSSVAGFAAWRTQWPGHVRVVQRAGSDGGFADTSVADVQIVAGLRDDIVTAALAHPEPAATRRVRIARSKAEGSDSSSAVAVDWPLNGVPAGWETRPVADTVGALVANGQVLVGPFVRTAAMGGALQARVDSGPAATVPARVIAWWSDGEAAAVEQARGERDGCTRTVAVQLPTAGDLLLSNEAAGLRAGLVAPCGASLVPSLLDESATTRGDALAPASAFRAASVTRASSEPWWLTPALLAFAVTVLLGEWWWRNREASA